MDPLKSFIHSLDPKSLPRILQIQSGFYDEGSAQERLGLECCLSTGDVIKVVGLKVEKILASNQENEDTSLCPTTVELSPHFPVPHSAMELSVQSTSQGCCCEDKIESRKRTV
uniref:CABIT domain-containing protein n=1 Tax=Varanus komodoensis TaxID=61221 RepID=A0A8D2L5E9_VARKO